MGLEQNNEQHYREVVDKYHNPTAAYQMSTRDYVLRPQVVLTGFVITLPPVAEAKGRFYSILAYAAGAAPNAITITHKSDSECWLADIVLDSRCDRALLYSDGLCWHVLANPGEWPGVSTTAAPGTAGVTTSSPTTLRGQTTITPTTVPV